jgi:hypothetical protein
MRNRHRPGGGSGGSRDIEQINAAGQLAREESRAPRVEVGLPREGHVQRLESLGRREELGRSLSVGTRGGRDLPPQQVDSSARELVERSGLRRGQQPKGGIERAGVQTGLRGG